MASYQPDGLFQTLLDRVQYWPNAVGRSAGRKLDRRYKRRAERDFQQVLTTLRPGDVCLDLGANRGEFTQLMAATGATVHAFEPDPDTFARLQAACAALPHVHLYQAAVGARAGQVTLRREAGYADDPIGHSVGSSVRFTDPRMDQGQGIVVPQRAFAEVVLAAGPGLRLIKMDIEGSELEILTELMHSGVPLEVEHVFVETHQQHYPADLPAVWQLRRWAAAQSRPDINLHWR
ncbi:MAG: FkbM family methyltransferase [Sinobacteraceae bacterium]|nr:FkbM family methyltransferase [Nevskiaceae bacterium]